MFLCFLISYLLNSKVLLFASSRSWVPWELTACVESSSRWHFRANPGIIGKLNGHVSKCQGEENFSSLLLGSVVRPCSVQDDVEDTLLFECKISECERSRFVLLSPKLPYLPICSTGTKYYWWRTNSRLITGAASPNPVLLSQNGSNQLLMNVLETPKSKLRVVNYSRSIQCAHGSLAQGMGTLFRVSVDSQAWWPWETHSLHTSRQSLILLWSSLASEAWFVLTSLKLIHGMQLFKLLVSAQAERHRPAMKQLSPSLPAACDPSPLSPHSTFSPGTTFPTDLVF